MKKFLGLALAGALSVAALPAVAADYPLKAAPPPIWTWTGFYVGVQAGAGWQHTQYNFTFASTGNVVGTGGEVGGTLGWNWQVPGTPWLFGIEGDWSWTGMEQRGTALCPGCTQRVNWLATARGRIGHINGPLLFYVTGGAAWAEIHNFNFLPAFINSANITTTVSGFTVGAGLEGALGGGWSLKGEYLFVSLGQANECVVAACGAPPNIFTDYTRLHIVRAGVNYKF